ncbi:MAG: hypothetical protein DRJ42_14925 [Deltaproteobacteria bacterium]|nr:MAG: hypothetical protein DRJ42_14925 [Deltaproteobacteria bacterium]
MVGMTRPTVFALALAAFSVVGLGSRGAAALDLHVAPGGTGDGSAASPFGTIDAALGAASDGDRVVLHEGDYGDALLMGVFGSETTVVVASGEQARFRSVEIRATHLTFRGATVSLSYGDPYEARTMVTVHGSSESVTVADCDIFSVTDGVAAGWGAADWANLPSTGVSVRAPDTTIANNRVRNVGHGISVAHDAPNAIVRGNHIDGFSRDGLRGIGDYGLFEYNVVRNAYDVDDHHDDFFQSWSVGADGTPGEGVVRGVVLRGNFFINFDDPARPFAGQAQGIGCFDGFFED